MASWIWLNKEHYPKYQKSDYCCFMEEKTENKYGMAEFQKEYPLSKKIEKVTLKVSGDTFFRLWTNGEITGVGPVAAGGDFLCERAMPVQYLNSYEIKPEGDVLQFYAEVRISPVVLTDYSCGHGGFYLDGEIIYEDGTTESIGTDATWSARLDGRYVKAYLYDGRIIPELWEPAVETENIWNLKIAPIPMLWEQKINPQENEKILVEAGSECTIRVPFDKIYSGYIDLETEGELDIWIGCYEHIKVGGETEQVYLTGKSHYRSYQLHSIGGYELKIKNNGTQTASVNAALIFTCYPVKEEGQFFTSDQVLNQIYEVCKWTLQICRQTLHLDSPMHQEPLACTGDYYIEALMTAFTFGDLDLARLDVIRTADWLRENDGVMFHTSYSLIWVQMLYDVYNFTGDVILLEETRDALDLLLKKFRIYIGETGLLDNAPDYMFVDWVVTEGFSMHHPPKALGETPLCAFYHGALLTAAKIYEILGDVDAKQICEFHAATLKEACNKLLYDQEKGLYFDGLGTPTKTHRHLPKNIQVRHYSKYGNTLAALYGLCEGEEARRIMKEVMENDSFQKSQPYFMHFILEALWKHGLFETYGLDQLRRWRVMTEECGKGLKEGWFAPQEDYSFDYSHAWGGTPAYQLPARLLGFEMIQPGFREIQLKPRLYGLEEAEISMPTPYGEIRCYMKKGQKTEIQVPENIEFVVK